MFIWIITYIFTNVLVTIYAPPNHYLAVITPPEVLPIVLFPIKLHVDTLDVPEDIHKAEVMRKKIVNGTEFRRKGSPGQLFFCPKRVQGTEEEKWCLAPKDFLGYEQLRCSKQPVPTVIPSSYPICGFPSENISYSMAYEFCDTEQYKYMNNSALSIYDFCFDAENKKTLYTSHPIRSAKLLESNLLYRERHVVYNYLYVDGLPTANQGMIEYLLRQQSSSTNTLYRVQQLVPEEDMALANWRKPTYQFLNTELQHPKLFQIWNSINSLVRIEAIRVSNDGNAFNIFTGVFDNGSDLPESTDGQMYNKWVKMITLTNTSSGEQLAGLAILMNNFLNFHTDNAALLSVQNELAELCPDDACANSNFKTQLQYLRGQMRCCMINPLIAELFNLGINPLPLLHIPGLTVPLP